MSMYAKLGGYVGNQPGTKIVYHDREHGGPWEEISVVKRDRFYDVDFVGENRKDALCLNKATRTLEVRAQRGEWGDQWNLAADQKSIWIGDDNATTTLTIEGFASATPGGPVESFVIRGRDFIDPRGKRRVLRGCDAFMALRIYLDQGEAGLTPFVDESHRLRFDMWRIFCQGAISQNTVMELRPSEYTQDQLHAFGVFLNTQGIVPLATCFVDNQVIKAGVDQWYRVTDALEGLVALASGGNEFQKNGFDPFGLPKPHGNIYWSRGSSTGDPNPYTPAPNGASFCEFHPNRNPVRGLMDATSSPLTIWNEYKITVPLIVDEPARFGTNGHAAEFADPAWARAYGQVYSAMQAGTVLHNYFGQRGLTMDGPTVTVAEAWQAGMMM